MNILTDEGIVSISQPHTKLKGHWTKSWHQCRDEFSRYYPSKVIVQEQNRFEGSKPRQKLMVLYLPVHSTANYYQKAFFAMNKIRLKNA